MEAAFEAARERALQSFRSGLQSMRPICPYMTQTFPVPVQGVVGGAPRFQMLTHFLPCVGEYCALWGEDGCCGGRAR